MSKLIIFWLFFFCFFANILGCSTGRKSTVAVHDLGTSEVQREKKPGYTLDVTVEAPLWLNNSKIYYRQLFHDPTVVRYYSLNKWLSQPSEIIRQQMLSIRLQQPVILKIQLLNFEQQFETPQAAKSILVFNADAYAVKTLKHLSSQKFVFEQYNVSANADGHIQSLSELIKKANYQLYQWLNSLPLYN